MMTFSHKKKSILSRVVDPDPHFLSYWIRIFIEKNS